MTISSRNRFFAAASVVSVAAFASFVCIAVRLFFATNDYSLFSSLPDELGKVHGVFLGMTPYIASYFRIALALLASGSVVVFITVFFRKTVSSEIFFFAAFAFSPVFEVVRLLVPIAATVSGLPIPIIAAVTKVVVFGRAFGVFALFMAGVYAVGFKYEKLERTFSLVVLLSLAVMGAMPVNTSDPVVTFGYSVGYSLMFALVIAVMETVSVVNFFIAAKINQAREYLVMGFGAALCTVGRECLYWSLNPIFSAFGAVLFLGGSIIFIRKIHSYYLWS